MYILIAVLAFGVLIATHELGHFVSAKLFGVKVNEYSIGMGPAILKKQKGETLYALRVLPIGGYCAMEGEDDDSDDPRSFSSQSAVKRIIILASGALMNLLTAVIILLILFGNYESFVSNTVALVSEEEYMNGENVLIEGDRVVKIDGQWVKYADDIVMLIDRAKGENLDITVVRDGKKITMTDFPLRLREYETENGKRTNYGVFFAKIDGNFKTRFQYSMYSLRHLVRLVRMGLEDLIVGRAGIRDMSGPVGIVSTINDVAQSAESTGDALFNVFYICAFLAVNLAVMNLLPLPALDGGRIFAAVVTEIVFLITRKRIDPKYEGYIHTIGFMLLLALMVFVMYNDIRRLI